eukprot:1158870-Rhodomonas_salina.1
MFSAHLRVLGLVLLFSRCLSNFGNPLEVLTPAPEAMIHEDSTLLTFTVNPQLIEQSSVDPRVLILLDGQQAAKQAVSLECGSDCSFSVLVNGIQPGPHVLNLLLLARDASLGDLDDSSILAESAVTFERLESQASAPTLTEREVDADDVPATDNSVRIVWTSPKGNLSSFLDPNNVHVSFRVENFQIPSQGNAELEISGNPIASNFANSEPSIALPSLTPRDYAATVFLTDSSGTRTGVSSTVVFHVWPDHSWVRSQTASGDGLSVAQAGQAASFTITARDQHGHTQTSGGAWYVVRLTGTASPLSATRAVRDARY